MRDIYSRWAVSRTQGPAQSSPACAGFAACMRSMRSTSAVTDDDSTLASLHGSVGDKPTKLIASARGRWRDFLRRPRERPASPPLIDAPDDLTKATESMNVALLSLSLSRISPFLLSYARPGKGRYSLAEETREKREFGDCPSAIARKTRVFHTFLLVFGSREQAERMREKGKETG